MCFGCCLRIRHKEAPQEEVTKPQKNKSGEELFTIINKTALDIISVEVSFSFEDTIGSSTTGNSFIKDVSDQSPLKPDCMLQVKRGKIDSTYSDDDVRIGNLNGLMVQTVENTYLLPVIKRGVLGNHVVLFEATEEEVKGNINEQFTHFGPYLAANTLI